MAESRKKITISVELLSQLLKLPEDSVIREIVFSDHDKGLVECFFVTPNGQDITPEGYPSLVHNIHGTWSKQTQVDY